MINVNILKEYLEEINDRERKLVFIAGAFFIFFLFYSLIYSPITSSVTNKKNILLENKQTLQWMEDVYTKNKNFNSQVVLSNDRLLAVLSNSLRMSNIKNFTYQLEQTSTGDIRLSFANVPYNNLINWLWMFCGKYALGIKTFSATAKGTNGIVSVSLVLGQD